MTKLVIVAGIDGVKKMDVLSSVIEKSYLSVEVIEHRIELSKMAFSLDLIQTQDELDTLPAYDYNEL